VSPGQAPLEIYAGGQTSEGEDLGCGGQHELEPGIHPLEVASERVEDLVGALVPAEAFAIVVPPVGPVTDGGFELFDRSVSVPPEPLVGQPGESAAHPRLIHEL
jgi:hypothetical protein